MAQNEEFDWIDDAFDDKRTAADIEKAKGTKGPLLLLIVLIVVALVAGLIMVPIIVSALTVA